MEIKSENIRIFMSLNGMVIVGEYDSIEDGIIKLKYPFRIIPTGDGKVSVASVFNEDEWIKLPLNQFIEANATQGYKDLYEKYVNQVHSPIIRPDNYDKKIII